MSLMDEIAKLINTQTYPELNGKTIRQALTDEANYLKELIIKHLNRERSQFIPVMYNRTGGVIDALYTDPQITYTINGNTMTFNMYVRFDDNAVRDSNFGANLRISCDDDANVAYLLNYGYRVRKPVWFRDKINLGIRGGWFYLEHAIDEFNSSNSLGIQLSYDDIINI